MGLLLRVVLGLLPVVLILLMYWFLAHKKGKINKKAWVLLFGLGMASALLALGAESAVIKNVAVTDSVGGSLLQAFIFVALIEEFARFLFLGMGYRFKEWIIKPLDFLTAGLLVSLGFSALENLSYAYLYYWDTMLARIFTAVPAHAAFGVIMGYFFYRYHKTKHWKFLVMAVIMPTLLHGLYDFFVIQKISDSLLPGSLLVLLLCISWTIYIIRDIRKRKFTP